MYDDYSFIYYSYDNLTINFYNEPKQILRKNDINSTLKLVNNDKCEIE